MPKVKVTLFSDREIEVPDDEIPVLRAQGLLVDEPAAASPPRVAAAAAKSTPVKEA